MKPFLIVFTSLLLVLLSGCSKQPEPCPEDQAFAALEAEAKAMNLALDAGTGFLTIRDDILLHARMASSPIDLSTVMEKKEVPAGVISVKDDKVSGLADGMYNISFVATSDSTVETQLRNREGKPVQVLSRLSFPRDILSIPGPVIPVEPCDLAACFNAYMAANAASLQAQADRECRIIDRCIVCRCKPQNAYVMVQFTPRNRRCLWLTQVAVAVSVRVKVPGTVPAIP